MRLPQTDIAVCGYFQQKYGPYPRYRLSRHMRMYGAIKPNRFRGKGVPVLAWEMR